MKYGKKIIKNIVIFALGTVGVFGLFSEPDENSSSWTADLVLSKTVAIASFAVIGAITYKDR